MVDAVLDQPSALSRISFCGDDVAALGEICQAEVNMAIWSRQLDQTIVDAATELCQKKPRLQHSSVLKPAETSAVLQQEFGSQQAFSCLVDDIAKLVEMFCFLFDLPEAGLRLQVLDDAMCPRFHVDRVPCRLVTTYCGVGTEWLPDETLDRSKLGKGNQGKPDSLSGIFQRKADIARLNVGEVALLKGESWANNQGGGLVHRSPAPVSGQSRLLMTLDFI